MFQNRLYDFLFRIDSELKTVGLMEFLRGKGNFEVLGTAAYDREHFYDIPLRERIKRRLPEYWHQMRSINTFSLYLFVSLCLTIEAIVLIL